MSNVAFYIGNMPIYWYGIIIAAGMVVGVLIGIYEAKRKGYRSEMVLDLILIAIPLCIIFARIYYVVFEWDMFSSNLLSVFNIRQGGLAIYGGVIGGVIAAVIFYFWRRVEIGEVMDIAAPGLIIGQAIGRWGNFMNQEAFGPMITDPKWQWFPAAVFIDKLQEYHMATFFYESMWNLIVFAILMLVRKKIKVRGGLFALYAVLYGFGRFWIEQQRMDSLWWGNIRVSEGLSELLVFGGIAYLLYMHFSKREYFAYTGYYELGLTEEQINSLKGKNELLKAQYDLKKAQWFADIVRTDSMTSPYYRAVKEKADKLNEKAKALNETLGADHDKVKALQKKAGIYYNRAEKIYAQIKLKGRLKLAESDAEKASALVDSLKKTDPDSDEALAALEKAELAGLLVEKIKDSMEEEKIKNNAWLDKAEIRITELKLKVEKEEVKLSNKKKSKKDIDPKDDNTYEIKQEKKSAKGKKTEQENDK